MEGRRRRRREERGRVEDRNRLNGERWNGYGEDREKRSRIHNEEKNEMVLAPKGSMITVVYLTW